MIRRRLVPFAGAGLALALLLAAGSPACLLAQARISDLTVRAGDVPRRLAGYGLVVGLDGTGDRSFGGFRGETPTVRSVVNLLQRFGIQVPPEQMLARNVAAVLVTAEMSPFLRAGGRFEVQVSSLGDATSLRGGVLWITPLVADPSQPPVATAQGGLLLAGDELARNGPRRGNSARIPDGGVLEADPPPAAGAAGPPKLRLRRPDLGLASRIATVINAAYGPGTARVEDPGSVDLIPGAGRADSLMGFLAAIDTLSVAQSAPARIVISARDGTVVAGGGMTVGPSVVSHRGLTLRIGGAGGAPVASDGVVTLDSGATVQEVAAGLHAAGATAQEVAAVFEALREVGAMSAEVAVR